MSERALNVPEWALLRRERSSTRHQWWLGYGPTDHVCSVRNGEPCRFAGNQVFPFLSGVEGADGDTAFQGIQWFGVPFPLQPQGVLVLFEVPVYGGGAYGGEFFGCPGGDEECRPWDKVLHRRAKVFPHLYQKKIQTGLRAAMTSSV
jgi:hypothetical protein